MTISSTWSAPVSADVSVATRVRVARAIFGEGKQALGIPERQTWEETEIGLQVFFVGLADAALAAARLVSVQARGRVVSVLRDPAQHCARIHHEYSARYDTEPMEEWQARALQIEGEALAAARPVPEDAGDGRQPDAERTPEEDGEVFSNRPGWPRPATDLPI